MSTRFTQARLLTVNEVADLLRVSRMTVYRLIKEGQLKAFGSAAATDSVRTTSTST